MAQTIAQRPMRVVGTTTNAPPFVETFPAGEALEAGDVVFFEDGDGKVYSCDGTALVTSGSVDLIDLSDMTTAGNEGPICGLALGSATASGTRNVIPVALFCPTNIFEANFTDTDDDGETNTQVFATTDIGAELAIMLDETTGNYVVTDKEGTERVAYLFKGGYGFAGETLEAGHGIVGDTNVRVRFIVSQSVLEAGELHFRV